MDDRPSYALIVPWLSRPNLFGLSKLIHFPLKLDSSLGDFPNTASSPFAFLFPSLIFKMLTLGVSLAASPGIAHSPGPSCHAACMGLMGVESCFLSFLLLDFLRLTTIQGPCVACGLSSSALLSFMVRISHPFGVGGFFGDGFLIVKIHSFL